MFLNHGAPWTLFLSRCLKFLLPSLSRKTFTTHCASGHPRGPWAKESGDNHTRHRAPSWRRTGHQKQTTRRQSHAEESRETLPIRVSEHENCFPLKPRSLMKWNTGDKHPSGTVCVPHGPRGSTALQGFPGLSARPQPQPGEKAREGPGVTGGGRNAGVRAACGAPASERPLNAFKIVGFLSGIF